MRNSVKFIVLGLAAAGLSACGGMELGKARSVDPKGSAFDVNLYTEYLALSGAEFDEADYKDSDTFAMRAIAAGGGASTTPEEVKARNIPLNAVPDLTAAHDSLVDALGKGAKDKAPMAAARAQAMYECWMQEQEENFQPADIAACRAEFEAAMAKVDAAMAPAMVAKPAPAPKPMPAKQPEPAVLHGVLRFRQHHPVVERQGDRRQCRRGGEEGAIRNRWWSSAIPTARVRPTTTSSFRWLASTPLSRP